jgi:hypothetical protein
MSETLTEEQAYLAMYYFLDTLQKRTHSDELSEFLGSIRLNQDDNKPMDSAMWEDWKDAIRKTKKVDD